MSAPVDVLPAGMTQVSKDDFYKALMAETRNVNPSPEKRSTDWMFVGTKHRWGWSSRGFCGPFDHEGSPPEVFALARVQGGAK